MCFNEQTRFEQCISEFFPILYKSYVDDTFVLFKDEPHVQLFLNNLNSQHTSINFSMEIEKKNKLPFLDSLLTRDSNQFCISIHKNPTFSGLGSSFFSQCPSIFKDQQHENLNVSRTYAICSNYVTLK